MSTQSKEPMVEDSVMSPWATHKQRLQGTAVLCLGVSLFGLAVVGTLSSGWLALSALLLVAGSWWLWQQGRAATISPLASEIASTQHDHHPDTMQLIREATDSLDEALMIFDVTIGRFVHVYPVTSNSGSGSRKPCSIIPATGCKASPPVNAGNCCAA